MKTSRKGVSFICSWEGFSRRPYNDGAHPLPGHATIGYGTLLHLGPVTSADRARFPFGVTRSRARRMMARELLKTELRVTGLTHGVRLSQAQFDALVSFTYNVGAGAFKGSTLRKLLLDGHPGLAAREFAKWDKAGGVVMAGLTKRRQAEHDLFLHSVYKENS